MEKRHDMPEPFAQAIELRETYRTQLERTDDTELISLYRQCKAQYGNSRVPAAELGRQDAIFYKGAAAFDILMDRWGSGYMQILCLPEPKKTLAERIAAVFRAARFK